MTVPVLLFAAGKGTRMAPLTDHLPKPLVPVAGKPLIEHALAFVEATDCHPAVVNVHHKSEMLVDYLAQRDILISDETDYLRETGGGLRHALPLLGADPVVTMNTDAVWDGPNPINVLLTHWRPEMEALVLVVDKPSALGHPGKGDFELNAQSRLSRGPGMIYTGVQIIRTDMLAAMDDPVFSMNLVWDKMITSGSAFGAVYPGRWCDVGQPSSIAIAEGMKDV